VNFNEKTMYEDLQKEFYLHVPFPISAFIIEEAVQAFFKFLEEPDVVKNHIDFSISKTHRRGDVGFKHRQDSHGIYSDNKDFFHFHPAIFTSGYESFLKEHPVVNDFLLKAQPIWELTHKTLHNILSVFEKKFPGTINKVFDNKNPHILLRFLKYEWQDSGKYLAKPHFDAGSFTLAIAESGPGLRIGSNPENLKEVDHKEGEAVFMLSSNFKKIMDTNELSAGWHDVIQCDESLIGKSFARWAVVAFIEASGVEALPKTETHKWYKEETL